MTRWFLRAAPLLLVGTSLVACKKQAPPESADASMESLDRSASKETPREVLDEVLSNFAKVHFDTDSAALNEASKAALARNAELLRQHGGIAVEVEGHADERGTTDYNLALGEKRANAVRTFLLGAGVESPRVRTVSFGEERPAASGHSESAWSQNRRAEFRLITGSLR
ncbi:MAG: peptidoglycan-associated lipoprotein Pal [Alphaproteobacteria bacterium]|nr:peptidoglycan-associated lipoprotein Pal [Alphaproteobacteria bacterium]